MKKGNWKRAHELFGFSCWDWKLVPNDTALNSASGYLTHFFQNVAEVPRSAARLENLL